MNMTKQIIRGIGLAVLCSTLLDGCRQDENRQRHEDTVSITGKVVSVSRVYNDEERMAGRYRPVYNVEADGIMHCFQGVKGLDYGTNYQHGTRLIFQVPKPNDRFENGRYHFFRPQDVRKID
jgi:hypothetical protein